jgi:hypothetical protein
MQDRFTLRFQNGERQGDTVPITSPRFTLGRRPGNTLQIQDGSVSGQHAELTTDSQGVLLKDLGSTNGTRLAGEKIEEARPAHGDIVSFGSINAVFEDGSIQGMPTSQDATSKPTAEPFPTASSGSSAASAGEAVETVSAEMVARSSKGSKATLVIALVVVLGGGGAAAYFMTAGGAVGGRKGTPVVSVPGNKIDGYSFEGDSLPSNWNSSDSAPAFFSQRSAARATGQDGLRASLLAGEWARLQSDDVSVSTGRTVELTAKLRAGGDASGRVGIEFMNATPEEGVSSVTHFAWGEWVTDVSSHQELVVASCVPVGASRARVVVEARAQEGGEELNGNVDVDDVSLVDAGSAANPAGKVGEHELWWLGNSQGGAQLSKLNKSLIGDLHGVASAGRKDIQLSASAGSTGFELEATGGDELVFRVESTVLEGGLATLGASGLAERGVDFEAQDVTSLLMGRGHGLVALAFERPVSITSRRVGEAATVRIRHGGQSAYLQVNFNAERAQAGDFAFAARKADEAGQLGECLSKWNEMLAMVPYNYQLVEEARSTRTRLEQAGLVELAAVEKTFEQAQFFRLVDLFRQCRKRAITVGAKYAGSAVETQSGQLVVKIDESLAGLEEDLSQDEVERLTSILKVLEATDSPRLAGEVRRYLSEEFGGQR